jgi:hypothetical protein
MFKFGKFYKKKQSTSIRKSLHNEKKQYKMKNKNKNGNNKKTKLQLKNKNRKIENMQWNLLLVLKLVLKFQAPTCTWQRQGKYHIN